MKVEPTTTSEAIPATVGSWIAFDLEWEPEPVNKEKNITLHPKIKELASVTSEPPEIEKYHRITTFAYEDSNGNKRVIDIADFASYQNPQQEFLLTIRSKLLLYDYCIGWASKAVKYKNEKTGQLEGISGDLFILDSNFRFNNIESIVRYDPFTKVPYIKSINNNNSPTTDIDLLKVFAKPLVKYVIFKNRYKSLHLHDVSMALLGYGKMASGKDIESLSVTERKAYCLQDAHIVADLVKINSFDSELEENDDLEAAEREQHPNEREEDVFEQESVQQMNRVSNTGLKQVFRKYKGAVVLEPKRGLHKNVQIFDVTSLYPTIIIKYNLSPETVNCSCCKNNNQAKQMFTSGILTDCKYAEDGNYWLCQRIKGLFAKILEELTEERVNYKKAGLEVESQSIKAIINSGYGVFGHPYFKYYDPRIAELVTAFGRYTLAEMIIIAEKLGFNVLYGDTDSLFVNNVQTIENTANKFIAECKLKLGIDIVHEKSFAKLILTGKKHYIGIFLDPNKEPIIKGMEGIKSDRPEFIRAAFRQVVNDVKNNINPIPKLKQALQQLDSRQVSPEQLAISLVLRKNPEEYIQACKQNRLGSKLGLHKDETLVYYKCDKQELVYDAINKKGILKTVHDSDNPKDISYAEYKEMLIKSFKDVLEILGYDVDNELLIKPPLINSSYFRGKEQC